MECAICSAEDTHCPLNLRQMRNLNLSKMRTLNLLQICDYPFFFIFFW